MSQFHDRYNETFMIRITAASLYLSWQLHDTYNETFVIPITTIS